MSKTIVRNLLSGQYQLGNLVFGKYTTVRVETFDVKPYDINPQDYQVSRADEMRFGWDQFKPTTIEVTFHVLKNWLRPEYEGLIPNFWAEMPTTADFAREWRSDEIRNSWGELKPLYVCGPDGITRAVYGRPGQFTYAKDSDYTETIQCLGEFRRADTLAYSLQEQGYELGLSAEPFFITREQGDGPDAWLRFLLIGPLTNPVITLGSEQIALNYNIEDGNVVEISSYPWQRRAVDAKGINLSTNLAGQTRYLDSLKLPYKVPVPVKWTSDQANTLVPAWGDQNWEEDIDGYSMLADPPNLTQIHGKTSVRFDLFNFGQSSFPWLSPRKYLGAAMLQTQCASIYNGNKFNTAAQKAQAQIVIPNVGLGQSVLTIMTNDTMTELVGVMVDNSVVGQHWLRIVSGSWDNLTVRASWQHSSLLGFLETDTVGIEYDPETLTYTALFNNAAVTDWPDTTPIIPTGAANRNQGFIFDAGGGLGILQGVGFCNIIGWDTLQETAQLGQVLLLWRDSWSTVG